MIMPSGVRKVVLTAHVVASVGWLGAVAAFLALAVAGLASSDADLVRSAYPAMELTTWFVIVPLAALALVSGVVQSLGTTWGLFRHWWVVAKLVITVLATLLLLLHTQPIGRLAEAAAVAPPAAAELHPLRVQLVFDAGGALLALLVTTILGIYKPRGLTPYGQRKEQELRGASGAAVSFAVGPAENPAARPAGPRAGSTPRTAAWVYVSGIVGGALFLLVVVLHLTGRGFGMH
jgi:hypothetical protein